MTISNNNRFDQFKRDCKIINLRYEYPGYKSDISWAIVSDLTENELLEKYPEEIKKYIPFIWLSSMHYEVFKESEQNNKKHKMREIRYFDVYGYHDEISSIYHPELVVDCFEEERENEFEANTLKAAIQKLKPKQRERIIKTFFEGKSRRQIAAEEGVTLGSVENSILSALCNLRILMSEEGDKNE